jgi:hypothetical protein
MKKSTTTTTTRSGRTRDAPSAAVASAYYHHHRHHDAASHKNKRQSSPSSSSSSSPPPLRYDFIDAFYGDIEQSLQESSSSADHTNSSSNGAVIPEVSSLAVAAHHGDSQASDSTLPNTASDRHQSSSSSSSSGGKMTAVTPPLPLTSTKQEPATMTPLGLETPPHLKRIQKNMVQKIRAVEPVIRTSLDQVPATQILGYRDYSSASFRDLHPSPRDPTFLQQQQQQRTHDAEPPPSSSSFTTPTPRHHHHSPRRHQHNDRAGVVADAKVATTSTIEQKERDRLRQTRSNRVLFVLALIAVICFAMICAVIILVVLNHLTQKSGDVVDVSNNDESSPSSSGRLFLGPGDNDDDGVHKFNNHGGREPSILPGFSGPTVTSAPSPASATAEMMNDPILSSILNNNPSSSSAASSSSSSSSTASSSCPTTTTTGRPSHPPLAGKKGAALTLREEGSSTGGSWVENLPKLIKLNPYWNYSYEAKRIVQQPADVEFIPMIWSGGGGVTANPDDWLSDTIATHVVPQIHNGQAHRLLAYHEPDRPDGANMSVDEAIQSWRVLRESTAGLLSLISPGAADPGGPVRSSLLLSTTSDGIVYL